MKTLALSLLGILAASLIVPAQAVDYLEEAKKHRVKRDPQEQQRRQAEYERQRQADELERIRQQIEWQNREIQRLEGEDQRRRMRGNR